MTDVMLEIEMNVGPLVQVVMAEGEEPQVFPWSDIAQEGDDPGMISDQDIIQRVARWLDRDASVFHGYKVTRPATGNILVSPAAVFGKP